MWYHLCMQGLDISVCLVLSGNTNNKLCHYFMIRWCRNSAWKTGGICHDLQDYFFDLVFLCCHITSQLETPFWMLVDLTFMSNMISLHDFNVEEMGQKINNLICLHFSKALFILLFPSIAFCVFCEILWRLSIHWKTEAGDWYKWYKQGIVTM